MLRLFAISAFSIPKRQEVIHLKEMVMMKAQKQMNDLEAKHGKGFWDSLPVAKGKDFDFAMEQERKNKESSVY
jgi:hypothetical protein